MLDYRVRRRVSASAKLMAEDLAKVAKVRAFLDRGTKREMKD